MKIYTIYANGKDTLSFTDKELALRWKEYFASINPTIGLFVSFAWTVTSEPPVLTEEEKTELQKSILNPASL